MSQPKAHQGSTVEGRWEAPESRRVEGPKSPSCQWWDVPSSRLKGSTATAKAKMQDHADDNGSCEEATMATSSVRGGELGGKRARAWALFRCKTGTVPRPFTCMARLKRADARAPRTLSMTVRLNRTASSATKTNAKTSTGGGESDGDGGDGDGGGGDCHRGWP